MIKKVKRVFDSSNMNWTPYPEYNKTFLKVLQSQFTDRLQTKGYVYLNEVLDSLGFEETFEGQMLGWVYNPNDPAKANHVDFGVSNYEEESITLELNIDSTVLTERFFERMD